MVVINLGGGLQPEKAERSVTSCRHFYFISILHSSLRLDSEFSSNEKSRFLEIGRRVVGIT